MPKPRKLSEVPAGETVRMGHAHGGKALQERLAAMGLVPGVAVTVLRSSGGGPVSLAIKDTRLALGRRMASKVDVE